MSHINQPPPFLFITGWSNNNHTDSGERISSLVLFHLNKGTDIGR
jgi:hypothetical protein